jgi:hypothetical protein
MAQHEHAAGSTREAWAQSALGTSARAPYVVPKQRFANPAVFVHNAVGGATFSHGDAALRAEVIESLRTADRVVVRDTRTQRSLAEHDIAADLAPDPGVMVAELFGDRIARHCETGEVAATRRRFPATYLAVQFSADFADDATLDTLAEQFDRIAVSTNLGMVFFRAGAAPMHDDLALYRRVQNRMHKATPTALFASLNIWDICGLIVASQGFVGSSLHGRIVALAHGLPRVTLAMTPNTPSKHLAFVETWEDPAMPGVVAPDEAAKAVLAGRRVPRQSSVNTARHLATRYREACASWLARLAVAE